MTRRKMKWAVSRPGLERNPGGGVWQNPFTRNMHGTWYNWQHGISLLGTWTFARVGDGSLGSLDGDAAMAPDAVAKDTSCDVSGVAKASDAAASNRRKKEPFRGSLDEYSAAAGWAWDGSMLSTLSKGNKHIKIFLRHFPE